MAISIAYLAAGVFIFLLGLTILRLGGSSTPTRATALILFFAGLGPILSAIDRAIAGNPAQLAQYRGGKTTLLGYFVGQVMKATGGKANPALVNRLLKKRLDRP